MSSVRKKILRLLAIVVVLLIIAMTTTYIYGMTFSHPRYWKGTIERVVATQASLIESLLTMKLSDSEASITPNKLDDAFAATNGKLIVDYLRRNEIIWTNENLKFKRGNLIKAFDINPEESFRIYSYAPPDWDFLFLRWIKNPDRWLEPSFDYVTLPFLWFFSLYIVSFFAIGYLIKSSYLEGDVMGALRDLERRYPS